MYLLSKYHEHMVQVQEDFLFHQMDWVNYDSHVKKKNRIEAYLRYYMFTQLHHIDDSIHLILEMGS